jgi:hypothetical protein
MLALVACCALAAPLAAQDSLWIGVHRVHPEQRARYDSLMATVWAPAMRRAAQKYPEYAGVVAARRRYVPTAVGGDSTYTYVYVYPRRYEFPQPEGGGNAVLRAAGLSRAQSDSFAAALRELTVSIGGGVMRDWSER